MKTTRTSPRHEELRRALIEAMKPFDDIPSVEHLAILAALIGQMMALQDASKYTSAQLIGMISNNIELGNANALTAVAMGVIKP